MIVPRFTSEKLPVLLKKQKLNMPSVKDTVRSFKDWKNIPWKAKCLSLLSCIIIVVQWCIIICCLTCLIIQVVHCIKKYLKKDTRVIQTVMPSENATFIAFTVCPSFDDAYKLQVLQTYGTSKDNYKRGRNNSLAGNLLD